MTNDTINSLREFNRFYTKIIGVINNHILESKYSLTEVRVMFEIYHNSQITARQIKEIVEVDEGYLSRIIKKLVKQHIIKREKSKTDSRISTLELSKFGEETFLILNQNSSDSIAKLIRHLNLNEQAELIANFQKIKTLLTKQDKNEHQ